MQQDIAIGMSEQTKAVGNLHAAKGDEITLAETVHIVAVANTQRAGHEEIGPKKVRA